MPKHSYLQWPVFRRSVVAAFQRSLTAKAGFPVTIECEWIEPTEDFWRTKYGHVYWAYERYAFRVLA